MLEQTMTLLDVGTDAGSVLSDAGLTVLIGLVVVFSVLLLLTGIFKLFGVVAGSATKQKSPAAAPAQKPQSAPKPAEKKPAVQKGIPGEVVAAITAAIAMMSPDGKKYAVRKIRRSEGGRSAWSQAGVSDNTRSF